MPRTTPPPDAPGRVLITGASAGIGHALAGCFARAGHALVLVARSADKLEQLAAELRQQHGVAVDVLPADLAAPGAAAALAATLKRRRRRIDILVNNAGVLAQGRFTQLAPAQQQQIVDLNISGLTALLTAFVPAMVARGQGRVLNVASIAAFQPVPGLATYAASKAYVLSLTESLAEELRGSGVTVTALCPGITATAMLSQAAERNTKLATLPSFLVGDVNAVAEAGWRACMAGEVICVPGLVNRAGTLAAGATPKWLLRRITGLFGRRVMSAG